MIIAISIILYIIYCVYVADIAVQKNYDCKTAIVECILFTPIFMMLYYGFTEKKNIKNKSE